MQHSAALLLTNAAATLFLTGLIWFVQIVHYPLFERVGESQFVRYEEAHATRTGWVVAAPMLVELVTALPLGLLGVEKVLSLGLLAVIWISTAAVQVPYHNRLALGFDEGTARRLVQSNWIRTIAWSLRAALLLKILSQRMR